MISGETGRHKTLKPMQLHAKGHLDSLFNLGERYISDTAKPTQQARLIADPDLMAQGYRVIGHTALACDH
jgi:hypothetical protein